MLINELRISNFIKYKKGHICKVKGVQLGEHLKNERGYIEVIGNDSDYINGTYEQIHFDRIPITEEWLINFGFKQEKDIMHDLYWSLNGFSIGLDFETWTGKFTYNLKYVHELQNLYYTLMRSELVLYTSNGI